MAGACARAGSGRPCAPHTTCGGFRSITSSSRSKSLTTVGVDDAARATLSSWKLEGEPAFRHEVRAFWIDADDLGAPATIGVTCLLAAIAFQFAEASSLPEVSYLYIVCYLAIAAALIETVCSNRLARRGDKDRAARLDRRCRLVFPLAITLALVASVIRAFTEVQ